MVRFYFPLFQSMVFNMVVNFGFIGTIQGMVMMISSSLFVGLLVKTINYDDVESI